MSNGKKLGLAIALFLASGWCCYLTAFHGWLTATPLTPEELATELWFFYLSLLATGVAFVAAVGLLVWRLRS